MTINQMGIGSEATIKVAVGKQQIDFPVTVLQAFKDSLKKMSYCIGVDPIIKDGKTVSFGNNPVSVFIKNNADNREYEYKVHYHGMNKDKTNLLLFSNDDIQPVNHRGAYRVSCSLEAVVQIGNNKKAVKGHLHDISYSGIGFTFLSDEFKSLTVGQNVSASVFDNEEHVYKATGHIVRFIEDFTEDKTLIGVQFDVTTAAMQVLVTKLQRQELRLRKKFEKDA